MNDANAPAWLRLPTDSAAKLPEAYRGSTPTDFREVEKVRPVFMMAATGEREKAQVRYRAPDVKAEFDKAHEGPREAIATPEKRLIYTIGGTVEYEVHTAEDRQKIARNQAKDQQMKAWREAKPADQREVDARAPVPSPTREETTPQNLPDANEPSVHTAVLRGQEHSSDRSR